MPYDPDDDAQGLDPRDNGIERPVDTHLGKQLMGGRVRGTSEYERGDTVELSIEEMKLVIDALDTYDAKYSSSHATALAKRMRHAAYDARRAASYDRADQVDKESDVSDRWIVEL